MNSDEIIEKLAQAVCNLDQEIKVTQMAQHLIALELSQISPDHASNLANTLENIANSDAVKTSGNAKTYLSNLSCVLRGDSEARIYGLEREEEGPVHWLRGVIDGCKE